jgi:chromosomal replication initiator protein
MTAEQFVSAFLESIQSGSSRAGTKKFRERFKGISHFLLDDIQYFNRKEATQTEFLYIMDLLMQQKVQIVLTGDRSLQELGLRKEIISRLEFGMSCKIELPERELLLSVFVEMVKRRGMKLGDDVCRFICSRVGMNVRRISGALNKLFAISSDGKNITVEDAEEMLQDMFHGFQRDVRLSDIGKIVSEEFGLMEGVLQSRDRSRQINVPRMLAMWLARKYTRLALSEIGRYFGDRSHSTVVTAQKKVDQWIDQKNSPSLDQNINITQALQELERKIIGI